jgi:hypothetical protein
VGVWCSFPAAFVAGSVAVLLAARLLRGPGAWGPRAAWVAFALALAASWAAMIALYGGPHARASLPTATAETWSAAFPPIAEPWKLPWWLLKVHCGYMLAYPLGGSEFSSVLTLFYVVVGSIVLMRRRQGALLWLFLGPLLFNFVAAALHRYPYGTSPRISLYMAPSFCLLGAVGLSEGLKRTLPAHWVRPGFLLTAAALGLIPAGGMVIDLVKPYRGLDDVQHRATIRGLARQSRRDDLWLVYEGVPDMPHTSKLMLAPWLQQEAEVRFYLLRQAPGRVLWIKDASQLQRLAGAETGRIWLIVHHTGFPIFRDWELGQLRQALALQRGQPLSHQRTLIPPREAIEFELFAAPGANRSARGL